MPAKLGVVVAWDWCITVVWPRGLADIDLLTSTVSITLEMWLSQFCFTKLGLCRVFFLFIIIRMVNYTPCQDAVN